MKAKRKPTVSLRLPPEFVPMCEGHGVEPDRVLPRFIADLCELRTAEYNTNGSDERRACRAVLPPLRLSVPGLSSLQGAGRASVAGPAISAQISLFVILVFILGHQRIEHVNAALNFQQHLNLSVDPLTFCQGLNGHAPLLHQLRVRLL
jgi:hypothetical protein